MSSKVKIGIPRALSYYTYYPLWKVFLEQLGAEVVLSKQTNREILEAGVRETVTDACIPIKVFHGHAFDLIGKADYLFIPRLISADGRVTFCPKFLGLPDMIRFSREGIPQVIDVRLRIRKYPGGLFLFLWQVARRLQVKNPYLIIKAMVKAKAAQKKYSALLLQGLKPQDALKRLFNPLLQKPSSGGLLKPQKGKEIAIALLGYPYAVFDPYISAGVYDKLAGFGVNIITFEQIPAKVLQRYAKVMPQNFFWYYSNQVCWAGFYLLDQKDVVDGIIHVTAFACGPDSMVGKTLELETKKAGLPFLSLSVDEHTGEGGVQTRLEAFVDMLRAKNRVG